MKTSIRMLAMAALGLALLATTGCSKLRARDQLNKGVQSYKNAKYEEAINHFQQAVSLDPTLLNARLYLATAFAQQYIPGVDAEDNNRMGQNAIDQYKAVLERDPKNINSVKGIAYLYLQMKKFEDAKTYYRKAIALDPNDPEPYYSVAVIDWTQSYQPRMEERAKARTEAGRVDHEGQGQQESLRRPAGEELGRDRRWNCGVGEGTAAAS